MASEDSEVLAADSWAASGMGWVAWVMGMEVGDLCFWVMALPQLRDGVLKRDASGTEHGRQRAHEPYKHCADGDEASKCDSCFVTFVHVFVVPNIGFGHVEE